MDTYVILLRGINVGGKNKIAMAELKKYLEEIGFSSVSTFIASGNVILVSDKHPVKIKAQIEAMLTTRFQLDSEIIKVLVLNHKQLQSIIDNKPKDFGCQSDRYHSDIIFLIDIDAAQVMTSFNPREGVDTIWPGDGVIYAQRLSVERDKSRLGSISALPFYKSLTIRNWNTVTKLLAILEDRDTFTSPS